MARPPQHAIDTFIGITGACEAVAVQKLEEHRGDLNAAVNAHFTEGDGTNVHTSFLPGPYNDFMDIDDLIDVDAPGPAHSLLSAARNLNLFSLIKSTFGPRSFVGGTTEFLNQRPHVSHLIEAREIATEFKDGNSRPCSSIHRPTIEKVTGSMPTHGLEVRRNVIIDDFNNYDDFQNAPHLETGGFGDISLGRHPGPNFVPSTNVADYGNDIEEEMIKAAIEASKREAVASGSQQFEVPNGSVGPRRDGASLALEDADLAHAVSLSLKIAKEEKIMRDLELQAREHSSDPLGVGVEDVGKVPTADGRQVFVPPQAGTSGKLVLVEGSTSICDEAEYVDDMLLLRNCSRHFASDNVEPANVVRSPPFSPHENDRGSHYFNGDAFQSDEWGGISSEEHDEAVMLEAAMFGGIPEEGAYIFTYPHSCVLHPDSVSNFYPRAPRPPSPFLTAQHLLRELQDDGYPAALHADREKWLKAIEEAERRSVDEAAARQAALEEEENREEEACRKLIEQEEFERILAAKQASLPPEPSSDDESALTLLIRMPDGSRCGRRFLKSDKLQYLFDYIDVGRAVKPGTYKLARPYPRRAFTDSERTLSLSELGLNSKHEALFLELS